MELTLRHLSSLLLHLRHYDFLTEENQEPKKSDNGKFGKDPTVETSFLPDRSGLYVC